MTDFRRSAALMADRLRLLKKLQAQAVDEGRTTLELDVRAIFESADQAALDAYEAELLEHSGAVPLGLEISA